MKITIYRPMVKYWSTHTVVMEVMEEGVVEVGTEVEVEMGEEGEMGTMGQMRQPQVQEVAMAAMVCAFYHFYFVKLTAY